MDTLHRSFNVSVAEADHATDPTRSTLVVTAASRTRREVRAMLVQVADAGAAHPTRRAGEPRDH